MEFLEIEKALFKPFMAGSNQQQDIFFSPSMEFFKGINSSTAFFAAAVLTTAFFLLRKKKGNKTGRKRSLSFSSEALLQGAFPPKVNVAQPIINCLFYLEKCPSVDELVPKVKSLMVFDRFRSGAEEVSPGNWVMTELGNDDSVARGIIETIEFSSRKEQKDLVDKFCAELLPTVPDKPLWRLYRLVPSGDATEKDLKPAILVRVHHVIGDGISMVGAMTKFFENEDGGSFTLDIPEKMTGGSKFKYRFGFVIKFFRALFKVILLPNSFYDSNITFAPDHSPKKVMAKKTINIEFPVLRLDFIKDIKNKASVTVNDVLLSACSGMIKRFSLLNNDPAVVNATKAQTSRLRTRALVPVAFPRPKKELQSPATALRNLWSFISVPLVIRENNAKERLMSCAKNTRRLKKSPAAVIQLWLQDKILSLLPAFFTRQTAFDVFSRHSIVFSNLPGPANIVKLCGKTILGFQISFPNLLPQTIIMSYNNGVFFNLAIDEDIILNSCALDGVEDKRDILCKLFLDELRELAREYNVPCEDMDMLKVI